MTVTLFESGANTKLPDYHNGKVNSARKLRTQYFHSLVGTQYYESGLDLNTILLRLLSAFEPCYPHATALLLEKVIGSDSNESHVK